MFSLKQSSELFLIKYLNNIKNNMIRSKNRFKLFFQNRMPNGDLKAHILRFRGAITVGNILVFFVFSFI